MPRTQKTTYPALPTGRTYLCVGPMCWGKDDDAAKAIANAKKNWPRIYAPKFCYILFDAPADAYVDDMGYTRWKNGQEQIREVVRVNMPLPRKTALVDDD